MFPFPSSRICFLIYILSFLNLCSAEEVDVKSWMCMDEKCSVPISSGKAAKKYGPPDHANKIAVTASEKLEIMRIPADPTIKYYYVKTKGGKEGLLLKSFVREDKLIKSSLVKVELTNESSQNKTPDIRPSAPTNVIDGTTLPPHEDPPHQYAPTLAQGQMNDVGTHSVVQSTTPPSDIDQPSSSVNSSESNNSRNASEGEPESKDTSYAPKQAEGQMNDAGTHSDVQSPTHSPFSDQSSSNVNSSESKSRNASEEKQESKGTNSERILSDIHPIITQSTPTGQMTASGIGISSTPESTISNDSSQFHDVPHDAIVVSATSSIHVGPDSTQIQKSQTHENVIAFQGSSSEVGNGTSVDDVKSDTAKEGESFLENVVNHVTATLTSGDTDSVNSTSEQTTVLQDDSPSSTPDESATPFGSSSEQVEADANIKNFPESNHINFVDKKVFTVDSDSEKTSSDHGVEQMKENDGSSAKLSSELSGYGSAEVAQLNSSLDPALVGKLESDYDSEPPQNVSVKQGISSEANSDTVGQQILDAAQFINEDKNMTKSDESVFNSSSPNDKGSSDASSSQTSNSDQDSDVGIEEVLADSEEFVSNINVESSKIGPSHSGSDETLERTRSHTPPDNVRSDFYKMYPRTSVQGFSSSTPSVRVPEVASGTTAVPPTTQSDETIPQSIVDVTTAQTSSPSELPEPELPPVSDANAEVLEVLLEEPSIQEESSNRWYSSIVSIFASVQEMFSSTEAKADISPVVNTPEVTPKFQVDEKSETCTTDTCESQPQLPLGIEKDFNILIYDNVWLSHGGLALMMITAIAVLLFSLGYYYLENLKRDVELVNKYNDLAGKLFIEQKEKEMLAEQLTVANESMSQISFDTTKYDEEISDLKALVQKYKEEKTAIEEKEKETRKKFMMVDKNYNELRNILSQNKQKGERSALILDIKNLKESIASNNIEIASLKEQLLEKKEEIKSLNARIMEVAEANKQLEGNVEKAISDNHKIAQKYQDNIAKLEQTIEESTVARVKLEKECTQLKKECESLVIEKELAESSLQKFQRLKPSVALTEWLDAKEVRVSLLAAKKKIEELTSIRDELTREKTLIEEKERTLVVDFEQLNEKYERAEKDKIEALTKLQVLSDYFKEKETQLQEELGTKESLWLQKQSDDRTIYEQMRALREENASFKNQNETLKREILDQEASFKKLITSAEEKAHENWVALRHQERRLKEAQMEAAQLRSRLTVLESAGDISDEKMSKGEVNGEMPPYGSATSPPFMLYPEFVPPPPLLQTTPSRPPPLGRISSPPLGDFTPPPPLVPYEMFLPPSPPPPAPHVLHKPQPLDGSHRIQKDSQSSNHSSESAPDRTRRNRR